MTEQHDVIIVGAGMAGLACARRLAAASVDFLVLEASNRVGGRAFTDYGLAGGRPRELGALMVHGKRAVTHAWIRELGLRAGRLPVIQKALFLRDGRAAAFPAMALPFHPTFGTKAVYDGVIGIPKALRRYRGDDCSLAEFLDRIRASPAARQFVTLLRAHAAAADADEIGILGPASEEKLAADEFGYSNFRILEGYTELAARRAAPLEERIRLRTRILAIRRRGDGVSLEAGSDDGLRAYGAKRVVVTLPLGVLKAGSVAFDPALPEAKLEAIRAIGFGDALVVQMRLRGGNLGERLGDFALLWGGGATTFHRAEVGTREGIDTLGAFTVGREARRRVAMGDREILEATVAELEGIVPRSVRVGSVDGWVLRRWPVDPLARGGYSFLPPRVGLAHRRTLAAPVDGVLFFAGEATHAGGEAATVHGAIESGDRAAREILERVRPKEA